MFKLIFNHEVPDITDNVVPCFKASFVVPVKEDITNADGKVVRSRMVKRSVLKVIPPSDFENRDLNCDLFSVENQKEAGVDLFKLPPSNVRLYTPSLDDRSVIMDNLNEFNPSDLTEKDFEPSNE